MCNFKIHKLFLIGLGIALLTSACSSPAEAKSSAADLKPTPTLVAVGGAIEKPVPYGYDIILEEVVLRIDEIIRSNSSILTNQDGGSALEDGQEFLLIRITSQCVKPGQELCFVGPNDYQVFDSAGNPITAESDITGLNELFTATEFRSGTSKKGLLAFKIQQGEVYPIMSYTQFNGSQVFLSLSY